LVQPIAGRLLDKQERATGCRWPGLACHVLALQPARSEGFSTSGRSAGGTLGSSRTLPPGVLLASIDAAATATLLSAALRIGGAGAHHQLGSAASSGLRRGCWLPVPPLGGGYCLTRHCTPVSTARWRHPGAPCWCGQRGSQRCGWRDDVRSAPRQAPGMPPMCPHACACPHSLRHTYANASHAM